MAVPVLKKVLQGKTKIREITFPLRGKAPKPSTVGELVDRLGPLYDKIQVFKAGPMAEYEKLCKELEAAVNARPDEQVEIPGEKYVAEFSICELRRTIDHMDKVFKILGKEKFLAECRVPLEVIDSELTEAQRSEVLSEARTGPRRKKFRKVA